MRDVLLDLDGTLTDPREGFVASLGPALRALGRDVDDDVIGTRIGPPLEHTVAELLGPHTEAELVETVRRYRERYGRIGLFENRLYPGIPDALAGLVATGCRLHLATSKPEPFARRILDHFGLTRWFTSVHGSGLDGTRADKIELIAHLLRSEGIDAAAMVGDRLHDVRGARAHGLLPVGVLWGYGSADELTTAGAAVLLGEPEELGGLVARLG